MENKNQTTQNIEEVKDMDISQNEYESSYSKASEDLKTKKRVGWFGRLYGLKDEEDEDLEFVYSSYSSANEQPSRF